ncbi:DciA family protein [Streptomyces sp. NPDC057837]|uniref:DciA family protein n=1 Tax=Streptomyces sp. NPDC057837 TaxID=3346260 RepID=UPI0036C28DA3
MADTPSASGADLARQALAAYKATAKNTPTQAPRKTRRTMRGHRGEGRDPQGLGDVLGKLTAEQGWEASIGGGNLIDQWATIAPTELAATVQPVAYDPERGILEVRPSSPAYATQIRLFQQQLAKHLNGKLGRPAVRTIRVLAPGTQPTTATADPTEPEQPAHGPVKTRETASAGYRATLDAVLAHRPDRTPTDPYLAEALARQETALRSNRQPEHEHRDAEWELDRLTADQVDRSEAVRRAAIARARQERAGGTMPRRAFDVA